MGSGPELSGHDNCPHRGWQRSRARCPDSSSPDAALVSALAANWPCAGSDAWFAGRVLDNGRLAAYLAELFEVRRAAARVNVRGHPHGVAVSLRGRGDAGHAMTAVPVAGCNR